MKKLLVFCLMICLLLSGCGATTNQAATTMDPDDTDPTVSADEIFGPLPLTEIGEFSDLPGGMMTLADLKSIETMRIEAVDQYGFKYIYAWEYSFALGQFTFYFAEEIYDEQTIYVKKGEDMACYLTAYNDPVFYQDPYADEVGYADELSAFGDTIELFVLYGAPQPNISYKRIEDANAPTGEAYAYEIYTGMQHTGYLLVDKATGLAVAQTDLEKCPVYQVTKIDMQDAGIPDYK